MAKSYESIIETANTMIDNDMHRNKAFAAYSSIYHLNWSMPKEMQSVDWIRPFISTDAHDAIMAGTRVLSSMRPRVRKHPYAPDLSNKTKANNDEQNLVWQLMAANKLRSRSVESEVVKSSLIYDTVSLNVIDLEWQLKIAKQNKAETKRIELARQQTRFVVNVFNPMDVHVRYSTYGAEAVLLCQERPAHEIKSEWSNVGTKLDGFIEDNESVIYYDYTGLDERAIWVAPKESLNSLSIDGVIATILEPQDHELEFFPWVALVGGSQMEGAEERKYHPMFYPLHFSGAWDTLNITRSLLTSEVIAHSASPRISEEGNNPAEAEYDYGDPTRTAKPAPGNVLRQLSPPQLDSALAEIADRIASDVQRSTVSRVLQGGDVPSGTAYSTLNLATQTAVGSLKPSKELSEKALAQMFRIMLLWTKHSDVPLTAYGTDQRLNYGENYTINPDEIDPAALYIEVELTPDVPTDRLQKANAASIMYQIGYPREYALEDLGVSDPQKAMKQWHQERLIDNEFQLEMQRRQQEMAAQMQMLQQQMAQQAQAEQQAQAQQAAQMQAPQGVIPGGQGFNPAMGGTPPIQATQGNVMREAITGQTRTGEALTTPEVT